MSGFHEGRIPDNIAYGATGGPEFATTVVATGSGHEKRNVNWSEARGRIFPDLHRTGADRSSIRAR